jgi:hypothetical protein
MQLRKDNQLNEARRCSSTFITTIKWNEELHVIMATSANNNEITIAYLTTPVQGLWH